MITKALVLIDLRQTKTKMINCPFYTYRRYISSVGMIRFHDNLQSVIIVDRRMSRRPPGCVPILVANTVQC